MGFIRIDLLIICSNLEKANSSKNNRTVSIDRNSSDKENNSIATSTKKASAARSSMGGRRKKSNDKPSTQSTASSVHKKKNFKNRKQIRSTEVVSPLVLSIEERVKLRRTTTAPTMNYRKTKSLSMSKKISPVQDDLDQIRQSLKDIPPFKPDEPAVQASNSNSSRTRKSFLGSGLDLDNILLGNRRHRSHQP